MADHNRLTWIDIARGIGILLVIIGHAITIDHGTLAKWLNSAIYNFHMPLFFIISGFLHKPVQSSGSYLKLKVLALLGPYCIFFFLIAGLVIVLRFGLGKPAEVGELLQLFAHGGEKLTGPFGVFWFITCLFFTQTLFNWIVVKLTLSQTFFISVAAYTLAHMVAIISPAVSLPWAANVIGVSFLFYTIGYVTKRAFPQLIPNLCKNTSSYLPAALSLLIISPFVWRLDMKSADFGPPVLGVSVATVLAFSVLAFSDRIKKSATQRVLLFFGRNSLLFMYIHPVVLYLLSQTGLPNIANLIITVAASSFAVLFINAFPSLSNLLNGRWKSDRPTHSLTIGSDPLQKDLTLGTGN